MMTNNLGLVLIGVASLFLIFSGMVLAEDGEFEVDDETLTPTSAFDQAAATAFVSSPSNTLVSAAPVRMPLSETVVTKTLYGEVGWRNAEGFFLTSEKGEDGAALREAWLLFEPGAKLEGYKNLGEVRTGHLVRLEMDESRSGGKVLKSLTRLQVKPKTVPRPKPRPRRVIQKPVPKPVLSVDYFDGPQLEEMATQTTKTGDAGPGELFV